MEDRIDTGKLDKNELSAFNDPGWPHDYFKTIFLNTYMDFDAILPKCYSICN